MQPLVQSFLNLEEKKRDGGKIRIDLKSEART